jgi:hypothetical protein
MNKVYIVTETIDGEKSIGGVYKTLKQAWEHASDVAEYSLHEPQGNNVWGEDEANCVAVEEHDLI